jgi:hypothetical protein
MEIVVTVVGGVPGGGDHGREEVFGSAFLLLQEDLVDEAFEDAPLWLLGIMVSLLLVGMRKTWMGGHG